jgi:magnesium-transporting ATPase (P-type)
MMFHSNDNDRTFERTMEETEDKFDEIERNALEEVLHENRRQNRWMWGRHIFRGLCQAFLMLGVYYLVNLLFLLGGPVSSDADFTTEEMQAAIWARLIVFVVFWAGAIAVNWWWARQDIRRAHAARRAQLAAEQQARREQEF